MAEILRAGSERDRRRVELAETRLAGAVLRAAQEEFRKVSEHAEKETDRMAQARTAAPEEPRAGQPMSADEGIEAEDTTFLYGEDQPDSTGAAGTSATGASA